ncbi:hypothetical protein [Pseudoneobacillus rhizosphaerae]|nr:hypothetical protein [Pseudoneobacillus rhizosphaerae]
MCFLVVFLWEYAIQWSMKDKTYSSSSQNVLHEVDEGQNGCKQQAKCPS